jgi:hypothetical protein
MNYTMNDELAEMRGQDIPSNNWHESKLEHNVNKFSGNRALNDFANDHSDMLRGADGRVHTEVQDDTMVTIEGMEMTYGSAVRSGLMEDSSIQSHDEEYEYEEVEEEQSLPTFSAIPEHIAGQQAYAERTAGAEVFESALMGSPSALQELAEKAGVTLADAQELIDSSMGHYLETGFECATQFLGERGNTEHIRQYFVSTAVSPEQKRTLLQSARRGDISGVFGFVEQYKAHYGLS